MQGVEPQSLLKQARSLGEIALAPIDGPQVVRDLGVAGIEQRLLDRVVGAGGSGLVRRLVWSGLRRVQNGRLQSYVLLGMLTVLVIVIWMVG